MVKRKNFKGIEEMKKIVVRQNQLPTEIMSTMGCRTQNGADINAVDSYKNNIKQVIKDGTLYDDVTSAARKDSRGNISPVTIIMPTLAMQAKEKASDKQEDVVPVFMKLLDKKINEARDMLLERFDWQCSQSAKSAKFMYENNIMYGYKPEEGIRSALKHGTLAIGQLGLAETLQILIGKDHTAKEGMQLAVEIETLFKEKCAKFKKDNKLNFGVYYTPAENLCYTAMKKFKEKYGEIKSVSDHDFFTNSMHVPVWKKMTPFEKIDIEAQLTPYSSAGCITYVEVDSKIKDNIDALEEMVITAMDSDVPYFAVNFPIDNCLDCGYSGEFDGDTCPVCNSGHIEHLGRVTGYLSSDIRRFNYGKYNEFYDRVDHEEHILM